MAISRIRLISLEGWLTVSETAKKLHCDKSVVTRLCKSRKLKAVKIKGRYLISPKAVKALQDWLKVYS